MFHQRVLKVSADCEQANMVEVFALNDHACQNDILHQTNSPLDLRPMISWTDFKTSAIFENNKKDDINNSSFEESVKTEEAVFSQNHFFKITTIYEIALSKLIYFRFFHGYGHKLWLIMLCMNLELNKTLWLHYCEIIPLASKKRKLKTSYLDLSKIRLFCHKYPIYTTLLNNTIEFFVADLQMKPVQPRLIQLDR